MIAQQFLPTRDRTGRALALRERELADLQEVIRTLAEIACPHAVFARAPGNRLVCVGCGCECEEPV